MSGDRAVRIARLEAWASDGGARFDALVFPVDAAGDCTARARRAIAADELIASIPRRLMIVERDARNTVATWLVRESRRASSRWAPFLDVWPAELPDLPIFRSDADLDALAGTAAHPLAVSFRDDVIEAQAALPPEIRAEMPFAAFAWGRAIIESRSFRSPHASGQEITFIPILDLMNHRPGDTAWSYDGDAGAIELFALRDFAAGDEVGFTYGELGNASLLVGYGFALAHNPHDEVALSLGRGDPVLLSARDDGRLQRAVERAGPAKVAAAARRSLDRLGRDTATGSSSWFRACALVRQGERAVLEQLLASLAGAS